MKRGSNLPPPLSTKTMLCLPVGNTALNGTAMPSPMSIVSSASTYISGRSLRSGFSTSIRTRPVRVASLINGSTTEIFPGNFSRGYDDHEMVAHHHATSLSHAEVLHDALER